MCARTVLAANALTALLVLTLACASSTPADESPSPGAAAGTAGGSGAGGANSGAGGAGGQMGGSPGTGGADAATPDRFAGTDASSDADAASCAATSATKPGSFDLDLIDGPGPARSWWVVTSPVLGDASQLTFVPPASPPAPSPTMADGRVFLQMTGSGLGLVDYGVLSFSPRPSLDGGEPTDLSDGPGFTLDAKGVNLSITIQTVDTVPRFCKCSGADCFIGYRYKLPVTATWATYTVTWNQFELPTFVVNRPSFDPSHLVSISFGGLGEDFDVSLDNLRLARITPLDAGEGGQ
jgi:hypothetical protein